jgi:hypothetical protein
LKWKLEHWKLISDPIELYSFDPYNIRLTDYITLDDNKLIKIDYKDAFELIAFEMMHRDMGFDTWDIDDKLSDIGIASIANAKVVLDIMDDSALYCSKIYKIGDSQYATKDGEMSWDYFGTAYDKDETAFTSGRYLECVNRSIDMVICLITRSLIENFTSNSVKFDICALNEDGIYFLVDDTKVNINNIISNTVESVIVRVFGRKFEVKPKITIF